MILKKTWYCLLILFVIKPNNLVAQYSPYLKNFSVLEYNAGNQNWDISRAENGKIYVANNSGLLEFDGLKWNFMELPNKTTIRSVLAYKDQIFTGSYEEFGYWKKNSKGVLVYTSLTDLIEQKETTNEEFWQIIAYKNSIIFRSFSNLYIYKNGTIQSLSPPSTVISCDIVNDTLYVSTLKNGIFILNNDVLKESINDDVFKDSKIISIIEYDNNLLICTSLKGCFTYKNNKLIPWISEVNSPIKQFQLNTHSKLDNGNMVFGTIQNGVYYTNPNGKIIFHVNKENGLSNNTILGQYIDSNNELWLGLDNGLALIDLKENSIFFNDNTGKLGAVYDVILHKGTIYIGSNTGLYFLDKNDHLQFVEGSQGQVWDLIEINDELLCGHNNGTYLIKNNRLKLISSYTGGWVVKKVPEVNNIYMQGTYAGIVRFKYKNGKWETKHMGKTTVPIRFLVFEDQHNAWAAHAYKGLYKIKFSDNYDSILNIDSYEKKGIQSNYNVRVYNIKNEICFKTNMGWQKYEPLLDTIVNYKLLNDTWGEDAYIISDENIEPIAIKNKETIKFESFYSNEKKLILTSKYFENRLIVGYENISKISDSIYALSLNDGFMMMDQNYTRNGLDSLEIPSIEKIELNKELIDIDLSKEIEIPFNTRLTVSISSAKSRDHYFEYNLSNSESSNWFKMDSEKLELSNLNNGDYTLLFRTVNKLGHSSPYQQLKIIVLTPWYKGTSGLFLLMLVVFLSLLIIYYLHKKKILKEQRLLELKFDQEQRNIIKEKNIENDKKIVELKNEALQNEITLKSKQLANTAMALVKKNEALLEIKKELLLHKNNFDNSFTFKRLQKRIDNTIGHEDEWEIFEYNFNQVHEEFFSQLKNKFPHITHKDLKICAYIKMNLSNKEIAPLMNISTRGVETHRYRLKRKLQLENSISLSDFLFNFK